MSRSAPDLTERFGPFEPAPAPSAAELALLRAWMPSRRWFPVKTGSPVIEPWLSLRFSDGSATVVHLFLVGEPGAVSPTIVQVPVLHRPSPSPAVEVGALLPAGVIGDADGRRLVDAVGEEEFWTSWLALAQWGERDAGPEDVDLTHARLVSGEQSNTSILFPRTGGGAILKVFRAVVRGANPDVDVPRALVQTGWTGVPRPLAWLELSWPELATGLLDLGVLSELVPDAADGFELACAYAAEGRSFANEARELGETIAQMHVALATALPTTGQSVGIEWLRSDLRHRARGAAASLPVLAPRARALENLLSGLGADAPEGQVLALQQIHGDLHLGQVLYSPDHGWRVIDFEGEPMRPLEERRRPDLPMRDVAGMLRSFDYAAAVGESTDPTWVPDAREAFLEGYDSALREARGAASTGGDAGAASDALVPDLRDALELDKALYEVAYEANNRPDWIAIPLAGVDRLLAAHAGDEGPLA